MRQYDFEFLIPPLYYTYSRNYSESEVTRHCIQTNYNSHASYMLDTRMLWILNIYLDGFISTVETTRIFINPLWR